MLNISPDDDRLIQYVNECQIRLIQTGEKWWGTYGEFIFCVDNSCVTLPRQIANVEAVSVCGRSMDIRGSWFKFLSSGPGTSSCGNQFTQLAGDFCTYRDIIGDSKKLKVYADVAEAAGAKITLQGYDENGQWISTNVGGSWIDGEQVAINSVTPQLSTKFFTSLVSVQKPETNGPVRLYEYDTTLLTQRDIAVYDPDETNPAYRRVEIRGLPTGSGSEGSDCEEVKVTVMAKLEFIPVKRDSDWLLIGNLPAIKMELMAILKEENNVWDQSIIYHQKALNLLREQLRHYLGNGIVNPVKMSPRHISGAGVCNIV